MAVWDALTNLLYLNLAQFNLIYILNSSSKSYCEVISRVPFLNVTSLIGVYSSFYFLLLSLFFSLSLSLSLSLLYCVILCYWINDATKCPIMSNERIYWHTLIVHYGTRAHFLNNNISRFESAFRFNCCHRCGSLSYSTMKSIDIHKHTLTHYGKRQFLHDDHTGNNNYNDNCNCNYNYNYNENEYENDNANNDLFDCNNDISNEVNYILCDAC